MTDRITTFAHDGLTFDVVDTGPADGDPVVLLHGFPQRATMWDAVARRLHEQGLRTLAPDQRGYSRGARPRARTAYRIDRLIEDVIVLVDRIGRPVHLVGHDWGALVAWGTAAAYPSWVRTLTTVSVPHPAAFARSMVTSSQALRSWYVLAFQPPAVVETLTRIAPAAMTSLLRRSGLTQEEVSRFEKEIVEDGALPGALGWYRALPFDALRSTGSVSVPTTHVWSEGDHALAQRGAELTGRYVDAPYELVVLPGASHWIPTQHPDRLADVVLSRIRQSPD